MRAYKLEHLCSDCPFAKAGPGLHLRKSLAPGRWREILKGLRAGQHFLCHKTTIDMIDEGGGEEEEKILYPKGMICAGARLYQASLGIVSDAEQIMSRLEAMLSSTKQQGGHRE